MTTIITLYMTYQQISIFDPAMENPFNYWKDEHVAQGFSWRRGSVGFGTLLLDGEIEVEVRTGTDLIPSEGVIRAIAVPFERPECGNAEIATVTESRVIGIPGETLGIFYQAGIAEDRSRYSITFLKRPTSTSQILVADSEVTIPSDGNYLMETIAG